MPGLRCQVPRSPSPQHLANLRSELGLLDIEANKRERVLENFGGAFELMGEQAVEFGLRLTAEDLHDLITMTPNYWHGLAKEPGSGLRGREPIETKASFTILEFGR